MRLCLFLIAALITSGCAHFDQPPPTAMVEVPDAPPRPPPPPRTQIAKTKMSARQAYLISGFTVGFVGLLMTAVGTGMYAGGQENQRAEERDCAADPMHVYLLCGAGGAFERSIGSIVLGVGVPTLATGIVLVTFGATRHK